MAHKCSIDSLLKTETNYTITRLVLLISNLLPTRPSQAGLYSIRLLDAEFLNPLEIPTTYVWSRCNFIGFISLRTVVTPYDFAIEKRRNKLASGTLIIFFVLAAPLEFKIYLVMASRVAAQMGRSLEAFTPI
jgi:hypothetical protein